MWQAEYAQAIAGREDIRPVVQQYRAMTGMSEQHLYRIARKLGWSSGRKPRADKGILKSGVTDAQIMAVAGLLHATARQNKGPIMPVARALEITGENGMIPTGSISPARMSTLLRERRISAAHMRAPNVHIEMRSLHPNHTHEVDTSVCIQYYLKDGGMGVLDERTYNAKKPRNLAKVKRRITRYLLTDHFSGAFKVKYYEADGESQQNLFDFLCYAWGADADERLPFRGVPQILLMDAASANTAKAAVSLLVRLGVQVPDGRPHNPGRQGSVESSHNIWERWFESGLHLQPAHTVAELNLWARDYAAYYQAERRHTRHGMTRTQAWLLIEPTQLRDLPPVEIVQDFFVEPEVPARVNGKREIRFRGERYSLRHIPGLANGVYVDVVKQPLLHPIISVRYEGAMYEAKPVEMLTREQGGFAAGAAIIGQEYKSAAMTDTDKAKAEINEMRLDKAGIKAFGGYADKIGQTFTPPAAGGAFTITSDEAMDRRVPIIELFRRLRAAGVTMTPALNCELSGRYGESVSAREIEAEIARLTGREIQSGGDGLRAIL